MKNWIKKFILLGALAFMPFFSPLVAQAGPFGPAPAEGFLLRGYGSNLATEPGGIKCKLFDEDGTFVGHIVEHPADVNGNVLHEMKLDDGSNLKVTTSEDIGVINNFGPVDTLSFPELAAYANDASYRILTVSTNVYKGVNTLSWDPTGAYKTRDFDHDGQADFQGPVKSIEVRCVFLVQMVNDVPVIKGCLKCHYFIGF